MGMPSTPFLIAAYAITLACLLGMLGWSLHRMRRAERALEEER